jgi:filamentous hemagglutinin
MPRGYEKAGTVYHFEDKGRREQRRLSSEYPEGVRIDSKGFPDFAPYAKESVKISHMTGEPGDFTQANAKAGLTETPDGLTWHHHQDCRTMQLLPTDLHRNVPHTGGRAVLRAKENTR